ncbi:MAG: 5-formyltetrahydrofolate cyclo-ligase [Candidatus Methylacidiphilales bacterium]|nr:5-formyltetrahydrofolate cyclo-ligase [Candidatus Methylacidiphilales bacterium]
MDPRPINDAKARLRTEMRRRLAALEAGACQKESTTIRTLLGERMGSGEWVAFMPLPNEPDIRPLLEARWQAGRSVWLPRVAGDDLVLHEVGGPGDLSTGSFGVAEPSSHLPVWRGGPGVCLVPGLAIDAEGRRLGRGRGYYDRLLARLGPEVESIGVFYSCQQVERVPFEDWDRRLDAAVTGDGWVLRSRH